MSNDYRSPDEALQALAAQLALVGVQTSVEECVGRILAQDVVADRDSPAADVSAMDGYAVRLGDLRNGITIPVSGQAAAGSPPPPLQPGAVVRIFTGAIVPATAEAVVKREDTEELEGAIRFRDSALTTRQGENIRRAGENAVANSIVLSAGIEITAAHRATMANFGCYETDVRRRVGVTVITTGDEVGLFRGGDPPQPWQLRNSNRVALMSLLEPLRWIRIKHVDHCLDDRRALTELIGQRLEQSDAILVTGGVSMGDYDHVPDVVRDVGGEIVFHGLPIRPGKPILGAVAGDGKLILGLPGNPLSASIGGRRMAIPLLAKISGRGEWLRPAPVVRLENAGDKTLPLHWMRLVTLVANGVARAVPSQGSGDLVSLGHSSGFVELPPGASGQGPWPYHAW